MSAIESIAMVDLTDKKAKAEIPPALFRRAVTARAELRRISIREARQEIRAWLAGGAAASDLDAWLRATYQIDPVGVTAVRNVSKREPKRGTIA